MPEAAPGVPALSTHPFIKTPFHNVEGYITDPGQDYYTDYEILISDSLISY
jgi:hypothetical protein